MGGIFGHTTDAQGLMAIKFVLIQMALAVKLFSLVGTQNLRYRLGEYSVYHHRSILLEGGHHIVGVIRRCKCL